MSEFRRVFQYPKTYEAGIKAAKSLGLEVVSITALGAWRSLRPVGDDYVDFQGPFTVKKGAGPAFIRSDGVEVFMLDDTSMVGVVFRAVDE